LACKKQALRRQQILFASRLAGWALVAAVVVVACEAAWLFADGMEGKRAGAVVNKNLFIQRVIACRHQPGRSTLSWFECERVVQRAQ
jgi:hypothetical protein